MKKQKFGSGVGYGHRTLQVEQLEGRALLAGNVNVSVSGGNLIVTGDNNDNAVLIQEVDDGDDNANTHSYEITGFDFADSGLGGFQSGSTNITGGGTAVDPDVLGGTSARIVTGVTANIIVDLKKGNDALAVGNSVDDLISLAEDCGFGLGLGSGSGIPASPGLQPVVEGPLTTPVSLIINMGDGNNSVAVIGNIGVNHDAGSLVINGGKNADNVAVGNTFDTEGDAIVNGDVAIATGKGDDNICVDNATIFGALAINAGDGFNTVGAENFDAAAVAVVSGKNDDSIRVTNFDTDTAVTVNAGNGNNSVLLEDFTAGEGFGPHEGPVGGGAVTVVTGSGNDSVALESFAANAVTINTGSGNDGGEVGTRSINQQPISGPILVESASIFFDSNSNNDIDENEQLGPLTIVTGAGTDSAVVEDVTALLLTASLGAGNDRLAVEDVLISNNLVVDAGAGNDFVDIEGTTIGLITNIQMGSGNDELDIFNSGGGSAQAMLIANGGSGRDTFFNDLGIDSNGNFDQDANGVPHEIIMNFEFFEAEADAAIASLAKSKKGW